MAPKKKVLESDFDEFLKVKIEKEEADNTAYEANLARLARRYKEDMSNVEVKTPVDDPSPPRTLPEDAPEVTLPSTSSASQPVSVPTTGGHLTSVLEARVHGGRLPAASSNETPTGGHLSAAADVPLVDTVEADPVPTTMKIRLLEWEFNQSVLDNERAKAVNRKPTIDVKKLDSAPEVIIRVPETTASMKVVNKKADTITLIEVACRGPVGMDAVGFQMRT